MGIQKNRTESQMEVEVKTGGYHFILFQEHITHERLLKGT